MSHYDYLIQNVKSKIQNLKVSKKLEFGADKLAFVGISLLNFRFRIFNFRFKNGSTYLHFFTKEVEKLFVIKEENRFKNHLPTQIDGSDNMFRGITNENGFILWRTNRMWNGAFYPLFKGTYREINGKNILEIKTRFNPFAELLAFVILLATSYAIISLLIPPNTVFESLFSKFIAGFSFVLIFQVVPIISFYNLRNQTLRYLKLYFNLTEIKIKKRK